MILFSKIEGKVFKSNGRNEVWEPCRTDQRKFYRFNLYEDDLSVVYLLDLNSKHITHTEPKTHG